MSVAIDFRLMCGSCLLDKFLDVRFEPIGQVFIHVYNSCTRAFVCRVKRMQQDWTTGKPLPHSVASRECFVRLVHFIVFTTVVTFLDESRLNSGSVFNRLT